MLVGCVLLTVIIQSPVGRIVEEFIKARLGM